jgi:hypothetical protein
MPEVPSVVGPICMVTFIDRSKVRHKRDFGRCYLRAGFEIIGETKGGLLALGLRTARCPDPVEPMPMPAPCVAGQSLLWSTPA